MVVHEQPARSRMVNTLEAAINICSSTRNLIYIMNDIYKTPSWQVKLEIGAVSKKSNNPT